MARKLNGGLRSRSSLLTSAGDPSCAAIAMEKPPVYVLGSSVTVGLAQMSLKMTHPLLRFLRARSLSGRFPCCTPY
jgi:hypothetical protein